MYYILLYFLLFLRVAFVRNESETMMRILVQTLSSATLHATINHDHEMLPPQWANGLLYKHVWAYVKGVSAKPN